jgi:hypothetical protein
MQKLLKKRQSPEHDNKKKRNNNNTNNTTRYRTKAERQSKEREEKTQWSQKFSQHLGTLK